MKPKLRMPVDIQPDYEVGIYAAMAVIVAANVFFAAMTSNSTGRAFHLATAAFTFMAFLYCLV